MENVTPAFDNIRAAHDALACKSFCEVISPYRGAKKHHALHLSQSKYDTHCKYFYLIFIGLFFFLSSCNNWKSNNGQQPEAHVRHLRSDTLNVFAVGDTFQFSTYWNSCCTNCFWENDTLSSEMLPSAFFQPIRTRHIPSDGAAGSSEYYETLYRCVAQGRDTIHYAVLPNGGLKDAVFNCEKLTAEFRADSVIIKNRIKDHVRSYVIEIR
jgi:hypothetical protein